MEGKQRIKVLGFEAIALGRLGATALALWCVTTLAQSGRGQIDWVDLGSISIART